VPPPHLVLVVLLELAAAQQLVNLELLDGAILSLDLVELLLGSLVLLSVLQERNNTLLAAKAPACQQRTP
jgi:hypothetical protein